MKKAQKTLADFLQGGNQSFKELPAELLIKAIEGHTDAIAPEARVQDSFLRHVHCPSCGGNNFTRHFIGMNNGGRDVTWREDEAVARPMLICNDCEVTFNPYSGMIIERPPVRIVPMGE